MNLVFNPDFAPKIINGSKIHTIRTDKLDRWKAGKKIHAATGVRTKNYHCFREMKCVSTQRIFMTYAYDDIIQISVGDKELFGYNEKLELAQNDGFDRWQDFFNWFHPLIQASKDKCFVGKIIHWTNKRY